ncbi:unnamed protein product [Meganyctiphanes norvegica]|uniref:Uncharacterized protein n=1 Tax=Meganyctiphanes norvegica TaxID=48144 RepID=A0AAV2RXT8_MEGNR
MAKVMKKLNPFNRSGSKNKAPLTTSAGQECTETKEDDPIGRRRLSISRSGRYKESTKRRSALYHDDAADKENMRTDNILNEKDKKNLENRNKKEASNTNKNNNNNINNSNINNNHHYNSLRRSSSLSNYDTIGSLDGHAVAEEIESLAKTLTMENARTVTDL